VSEVVTADAPPAHHSETAERSLEAIYYIDHEGEVPRPGRLAEWLGVSAPTVTVSLQRLARDGLIRIADDRSVELSDAGADAAATIVRRHSIVERWLTDVLGFDWATADLEAQSLSHGMSATVLERIDESLGRPITCPHGNVIPGRTPPAGRRLIRLVELEDGDQARVARISEVAEHEAPHLLNLLHERGIVPGIEIGVVARSSSGWVLTASDRQMTIDPATARAIWVEAPTNR